MLELLNLPELASAHGGDLDAMTAWIHWLMLLLFVGWGGFFVWILFRFRASRNPKADYVGTKGKPAKWLEIGVAVAEAVLLIGFSIPLWAARVDQFPPEEDATVVRVIAEQFAWNMHYPGADGVFGKVSADLVDPVSNPIGLDRGDPHAKDDITTINQLHLPVDKDAIVHLSSKDVVHSFALQEFRVKQDAIPGIEIPLWFTPTVTTEEMRERKNDDSFNYEIACAQLCGLGHYRMRGYVTIHSPQGYQDWLDEQAAQLAEEEEGGGFWE